jgi:chromosome segregation ATPase
MKGFITEARDMKKSAKIVEDRAKEVKDKLKQLEESVMIGQINQKNIDLEFDKAQNEYYAAIAKTELLQQKLANADATQRVQAVKMTSFGNEAEECNKKSAEADEKYFAQMERMGGLRKGLKSAHAKSVMADKESSLKQMEVDAAKHAEHDSLQRLREAEHELEKMEGEIVKYAKIGELWEAKCEQLEIELTATKLGTKQLKGLNEDSHEVTEELKEEAMFLQMNIRGFEQRAEFAENIIDKLEQNCEKLNDSLFIENSKFMDLSLKLENGGNMQNIQQNQQQNQVQITETLVDANTTPYVGDVQQDRLLAASKMELPMSPAAKTPTQDQEFILEEENEAQFETEEDRADSRVLQSDIWSMTVVSDMRTPEVCAKLALTPVPLTREQRAFEASPACETPNSQTTIYETTIFETRASESPISETPTL